MRLATMTMLLAVVSCGGCRSLDPIGRPDGGDLPTDAALDPGTVPFDVSDAGGVDQVTDATDLDDDGVAGDSGHWQEDVGTVPDDTAGDAGWKPVARDCSIVFSYTADPGVKSVTVPGEWNSWDESAHPMSDDDGDGTFTVTLGAGDIPTGLWGYKLLVDGKDWILDPSNPLVKYVGADHTVNSRVEVPDCGLPYLELESVEKDYGTGSVTVSVKAFTGVDGQPLDPTSLVVEDHGAPLAGDWFDPGTQTFTVERKGLEPGKHSLVFRAANEAGQARPLFVPVWLEEEPFDWRDAVMYFAMTDRFRNGDTGNDAPAPCLPEGSKANWLGGDFEGIRQAIAEGYFDDLGVSAIWISPANLNPDGCMGGDLGLGYTAYHGYFPVSLELTDGRFGSLEDLRSMVGEAHTHGIRVLMDFAANHVHESSDLWTLHKDWFHQDVIICGEDDNWNQHPIDCWFQPYLPDLDYRNADAVDAFVDSAIRWAREADLDGFRVDAVKHMIHDLGRTLKYRVRRDLEASGVPFYLVGETYVSEWGGGQGAAEQTIKAYVSPDELSGQFDFPLYWEVLKAFGRGEGTLGQLAQVAKAAAGFYGDGAVMSNFLGNHDVPRFISHASGAIPDQWGNGSKEIGWNDPPDLPQDVGPYEHLKQAFAFLMSVPGIPLIYYGDEIAMPGAGDPDNRRMMQFDGLTAQQAGVREAVSKLAAFRAAHPATRRGAVEVLWSDDDGSALGLDAQGDIVVAVFNRAGGRDVSVPVSSLGLQSGFLADGISGDKIAVTAGQVTVTVPEDGYRLLSPATD